MRSFAQDLLLTVQNIRELDSVAVKVADADISMETQMLKAAACSQLYGVMEKKAAEEFPEKPQSEQILQLVEKVASLTKKKGLSSDMRLKIAAAVATDMALTSVMGGTPDSREHEKLAESRAFGREFFVELVGKAI